MRSDCRFDDAAPAFTLICPGYKNARHHDGAARGDGNLTFTIGSSVIAEIGLGDLIESWEAAVELTTEEAAEMTEAAALHLTELLADGLPAADITDAVADAAVVFLLAMRRSGISDPKRIPPCTVMWNGHDGRERVFFGA